MNTPPAIKANPPWKAVLVLLLVFCLGAASGAAGMLSYAAIRMKRVLSNPATVHAPGEVLLGKLERRARREKGLSDAQREAILGEIQETRKRLILLRMETVDELKSIGIETIAGISAHLPPGHREDFEKEAKRKLKTLGLETNQQR